MKKRKTKDFSFQKFFNPWKSPIPNIFEGRPPMHSKRPSRLIWDSKKWGTYNKAIHGKII